MGSKILFKLVFINIVTGWAFTFFAVYVDHIPFENVYVRILCTSYTVTTNSRILIC
jgi:hypothetical protein